MAKFLISLLILIYLITNTSTKYNPYTPTKLKDLTRTAFRMNKEFIIFEYENKEKRIFNSSINFIFDNKRQFTKVYLYDSLDRIEIKDDQFVGYLYEKDLYSKNYIKISYNDNFYKDNCTFYLVLDDPIEIYDDFIYVVNSLKYLDFGDEIIFTHTSSISFNFIIKKNISTYLHYQTKPADFPGSYYNISIINEKGEFLLNDTFNNASGYIKIESNTKYNAYIKFFTTDVVDYSRRTFSLNYENYKNNILVNDENEINRTVLSPQNYTFFKSISNFAINESIIFTGYYSGTNQEHEFYIKTYESDDFVSLVNSFPTDKSGFDSILEKGGKGKNFTYEIKKENKSQKGILFGFYVGKDNNLFPNGNKIYLRVFKAQPKKEEIDSDKNPDPPSKGSSLEASLSDGAIIAIVIASVIIFVIMISVIIICVRRKRNNRLQNEINTIGNNYKNYNDNTPKNQTTDNYKPTSRNNSNSPYDNKIEPNGEYVYDDLSACPPVNDN